MAGCEKRIVRIVMFQNDKPKVCQVNFEHRRMWLEVRAGSEMWTERR
jgi:hypothetical protein